MKLILQVRMRLFGIYDFIDLQSLGFWVFSLTIIPHEIKINNLRLAMEAKKIIIKIMLIILCIISIHSQPSRNKDSQKLSNQYMKKKTLCQDNLCAASGNFIIKKRLLPINLHKAVSLSRMLQESIWRHNNWSGDKFKFRTRKRIPRMLPGNSQAGWRCLKQLNLSIKVWILSF